MKSFSKQHASNQPGFVDLLNYSAVVADGVVVLKNGGFLAGWQYSGPDAESLTAIDKETIAMWANQALKPLGNGWAIHVDVVRTPTHNYSPSGLSHFPDPVTRAIDEERRTMFAQKGKAYVQNFYLTVSWLPPVLVETKFFELMFDDGQRIRKKKSGSEELITQFQNEVTALESKLSICFKLRRLLGKKAVNEDGSSQTYDELLSHIWCCISGEIKPVLLPDTPMYLDTIFGKEIHSGLVPKIGRSYLKVITIDGFPLESTPGILGKLSELPCEYRWNTRFIFMDQHEALSHLNKHRRAWKQKIRGFLDQIFQTNSGRINQDAADMVVDIDEAIREVNSGIVTMGYYTTAFILFGEDAKALEEAARSIEKEINSLGFNARIETLNTLEAWLGSLPGHCDENVRRPLMNTLNLGHMMPTSAIWTGLDKAPCPFYGSLAPALMSCTSKGVTPFWLNLHVNDVGHTIMFGPTGAGKSTHLAVLVAQMLRYQDMSIFVFDKGHSIYPLIAASGGDHYVVEPVGPKDKGKLTFCPLQYLDTQQDRAWAAEWIETILELNRVMITPEQRNEISVALKSMYDTGAKSLTEFGTTIQSLKIREGLTQYTVDGGLGYLLDANTDNLTLGQLTAFEIEELFQMGEKYALPVLLYLFRRIEKNLTGQPAAIVLDEAWIMLGHPLFREKIREWLKVMRKANCLVLMATQSLSDAARSGILDVIVESTATKIFLPNPHAKDEANAALYQQMGLNDRQIQIISEATPKREYYYVSEKGMRLYELSLGKLALAFCGSQDKESIATIKKLVRTRGVDWVNQWLTIKNLPLLS
jgi:type IV secretion system protein TrbE